ncbi:MAG: 3-deoxy-D-manno-octulosonic acid transferase, partial [Acidobacteria bacterium]|nr:3-deoxy-D-manno-octulosonic acid transferase [Acidobacteriota bacterium]
LDTIGELPYVYEAASCVFVGGSLVPAGGHNILEPAAVGKAILFGPHMESFAEIAHRFVARDAAVQVRSADDLESQVTALLDDGERRRRLGTAARAVIDTYRGATSRTLAAVAELLPPGASAGACVAGS